MQNSLPGAPFEMQIQGADKGGVSTGSDAAKSWRCTAVHISLKYERHHLCCFNPLFSIQSLFCFGCFKGFVM